MTIQNVINYTDEKILNWYESAKREYNVIGAGKTHYNKANNEIVVEYTENGDSKTWSMAFYPEYLENGIDWVYKCWQELS
jgi:hypothetical protein